MSAPRIALLAPGEMGAAGGALRGAAERCRRVAATPLGQETPETRDRSGDGRGLAEALARMLG